MVGVPYRRITHLRKHLALEFVEAGHILGSRLGRPADHRGRQPPAGVLRRHRPERTPDHPRPRAALGADRHADRRVHLRRPGPRVAWPAPRSGWARRSAGPPRAAARCSSRPSRSGGCRSSSTACTSSTARGSIPDIPIYVDSPLAVDTTTGVPDASRGVRPAGALIADEIPLFDFSLVRYVRDVAESKALNQLPARPSSSAASRHGGVGPHPPPPRHGIGDHRNLVLFVGFQAEHTLGRRIQERRRGRSGSSARSIPGARRGRDHRRLLGPRRPQRAAAPGCAGSAGPSGGPSWCTARPRRSAPWPRSSARKACATCRPAEARRSVRPLTGPPVAPRSVACARRSGSLLLAAAIVYTVSLVMVLVVSQQDQRRAGGRASSCWARRSTTAARRRCCAPGWTMPSSSTATGWRR